MNYRFVDFLSSPESDVWAECYLLLKQYTDVAQGARAITKYQQRQKLTELIGPESSNELWNSLQSEESQRILKASIERLKNKKKK